VSINLEGDAKLSLEDAFDKVSKMMSVNLENNNDEMFYLG
jgi:hypothetical protein